VSSFGAFVRLLCP